MHTKAEIVLKVTAVGTCPDTLGKPTLESGYKPDSYLAKHLLHMLTKFLFLVTSCM